MNILKDILDKSAGYLEEKNIANARRQAEEVIADALEMKRLELYLQFDRPLNDNELARCREGIKRRSQGEPSQQIKGSVEFFECTIHITRDVLIPRQETEILVAKVIEDLKAGAVKNKILWDVCCGSGCIGIAIKKKFPELQVYLSDLSREALGVARKNAEFNGVEVSLLEGDLLEPFFEKKADFIVCNPPYISSGEYDGLDSEVRNYEPKMALVAENEGLDFYQRLEKDLPNFLNPSGKAWFEIGYNQGNALVELFKPPKWKYSTFENDWSGNNRFFFLEIE